MKPVIITITGESGVGKTLIADYIEKVYCIKMIQSYTDRRPRYDGENGHTFVSKLEFDLFDQKDMIALTNYGGNRYCCLKSDVLPINTYVIDEDGVKYLEEHFKNDYDIIKLRVYRQKELRLKYISEERINRDNGRYNLPESYYNTFVYNDDTKEILYSHIDIILKDILDKLKWEYLNLQNLVIIMN